MNPQKDSYLELIYFKSYASLRAEAARGYLGIIWWGLEPILYLSVFYILSFMRQSGENHTAKMIVGLVAWKWFASTLTQGANSIAGSVALMQQVYLPKYVFPAVSACINLFKFFIVFVLTLFFLLALGIVPTVSWLFAPIVIVVQFAMMAAISGILAALVPFIPDLKQVIGNGLMLLFFLSGIFFDISKAPPQIKTYLYLNPMLWLIKSYRELLIQGNLPDWRALGVILVGSALGIGLARILLCRFDKVYPKISVR